MLGRLLKAKIAEQGLVVTGLCKTIGMPYSTWNTRINGTTQFRVGEVKKIADVLHLSDNEIILIFFNEELKKT